MGATEIAPKEWRSFYCSFVGLTRLTPYPTKHSTQKRTLQSFKPPIEIVSIKCVVAMQSRGEAELALQKFQPSHRTLPGTRFHCGAVEREFESSRHQFMCKVAIVFV